MTFKRIKMGEEEIFELKMRDSSGKTLEKWTVNKSDVPLLMSKINKKYSLGVQEEDKEIMIDIIKALNMKMGLNLIIKKNNQEKDLDWLN